MSKAKGLPMTGWCVRALLAGQKTQTRRVIRPQPPAICHLEPFGQTNAGESVWVAVRNDSRVGMHRVWKPNYQPGDLVYIKEALVRAVPLCVSQPLECGYANYEADNEAVLLRLRDESIRFLAWPWQRDRLPSIFMPREAARIFRRISGVRAERLQEITREDALAEGACPIGSPKAGGPIKTYSLYWDQINAKRGYPWSSNPWVWVYGLEEVE